MSSHAPKSVERRCDVAIIGGSAAGLAAALQIGRQRRSVIVIDAGEPRNTPAAHMHSYLGHEGLAPAEFADLAREEARSYGAEILAGRAIEVTLRDDGQFRVELVGGHAVVARRVLAASGIVDELPDIEGLAEHWGSGVIHCPFCHGYEARDQRIVQIITHPMGLHSAGLFRQLTQQLTLVLHDGVDADDPRVHALHAAGVSVVDRQVRRVVADDAGRLVAVELEDASLLDADVVVVGGRFRIRAEALATLGVAIVAHPSGLGDVVETDATGESSVAGVYAAGNVTDPGQQVLQAAANGSRVAGMICISLAEEDVQRAEWVSANQVDWEHRYGGEQIWSGNPNGTLVREAGSLAPGRALDVGAGEGGDAVWLAEHGWQVTASDIAERALARLSHAAADRDLTIEPLHADANGIDAFESAAFDLVTAHYASIPRTPDNRAVVNILDAVAVGGTLLVVGHDLEPMRQPIDTHEHSRAFDPDAYVRVDDFAEVLRDSTEWHIVHHEKRTRPPGAASASHHVDDVVLRAYRHASG